MGSLTKEQVATRERTRLAALAAAPAHPLTRYVDTLGSLAVAAYLLGSGCRAACTTMQDPVIPARPADEHIDLTAPNTQEAPWK